MNRIVSFILLGVLALRVWSWQNESIPADALAATADVETLTSVALSIGDSPDLVPADERTGVVDRLAAIVHARTSATPSAIWALGRLGLHAESAAPLLLEALRRGQLDPMSIPLAATALRRIAPHDPTVRDALAELAVTVDPFTRLFVSGAK